MIKKKKIWIALTIIIMLIIVSLIYTFLNGTPWGKYIAYKDAEQYLANKYLQKMVIDYKASGYEFKQSDYYFIVHPEKNLDFQFTIEKTRTNGYSDNYYEKLLENQVNTQFNPYVQSIYSKNDKGYIKISIDPLSPQLSEKNIDITKYPSYKEIENKLKLKDFTIMIHEPFDDNDIENECEKMFKITTYINQNYLPTSICFFYDGNDQKLPITTFSLNTSNEIRSIKTSSDILQYKYVSK